MPSIAALPRSGARKASESVRFTLRTLTARWPASGGTPKRASSPLGVVLAGLPLEALLAFGGRARSIRSALGGGSEASQWAFSRAAKNWHHPFAEIGVRTILQRSGGSNCKQISHRC